MSLRRALAASVVLNVALAAIVWWLRPATMSLQAASMNGRADVVRRILSADKKNKDDLLAPGEAPIVYAVNYGYTDVVREFVAHGARGDVRSVYQETPLLTATYYRRSDIIELIARGGWDVNVKDKDGLTPLVWAARFGLLPELKQLLGLGAQVNVHSRYGFTPLIVAASMGNTPEALQLLKSGADPALRDAFGQTALHQAAYLGSREIVRALLAEPRTDVSAVNALRLTPLDYAWANSHHEVARALIAAGASLTVKDPHGHGQAFRLLLNGFPAEELRRKLGEGPPFSADECRMLGRGLWCP